MILVTLPVTSLVTLAVNSKDLEEISSHASAQTWDDGMIISDFLLVIPKLWILWDHRPTL